MTDIEPGQERRLERGVVFAGSRRNSPLAFVSIIRSWPRIEENLLLRRQLGRRRLRLTNDDRRRLAARAHRLGRQVLRDVATIATPDTLLRWHRQLIARDVREAGTEAARHSGRDPAAGHSDGRGESDLGLHKDPRRFEEGGAPRGPPDHSADLEDGGVATGPATADLVPSVSQGPLGRYRRRGFLYD